MNKYAVITGLAIILAIALAFGLGWVWNNSDDLALKKAGMDTLATTVVVAQGIDANGQEYQVVAQCEPNSDNRIAHLIKNGLGLWELSYITERMPGGLHAYSWTLPRDWRRFGESDMDLAFTWEYHSVFTGNDARKIIELPLEKLPPNVTVHIQQMHTAYVLHFISYGEKSALNGLDWYALLQETGSVSSKLPQ